MTNSRTTARNKQNRSENTRQALLESAIRLFSEHGFAAVSNRDLAADADVNQALIGYHFGSKEGLYLTVFEYLAEDIQGRMEAVLPSVVQEVGILGKSLRDGKEQISEDEIKQRSVNALIIVINAYSAFLLDPEVEGYAKLVMREQLMPSDAFEILWEKCHKEMLGLVSELVALSCCRTEMQEEDKIMALTLMGQVLVFRVGRATVNRHLEWSDPHPQADRDAVQRLVESNIRRLLHASP